LFYPPGLNEYTYFRAPITAKNTPGWIADAAVLAYSRSGSHLLDRETFVSIFTRAGFDDAKLIQKADILRSTHVLCASSGLCDPCILWHRVLDDANQIAWDIVAGRPPIEDLADHSPSRYLHYLWP
jgi:hypothetical protein